MNAKLSCAISISLALSGCAIGATSARTTTPTTAVTAPTTRLASTIEPTNVATATMLETTTARPDAIDTSTLPTAPWAGAPLAAREAPAQILEAWENAENRGWCAPLAPRSLGAAEGASARTSSLYGGWAVEFDRRGLPGVDRAGNACEHCGRGVFGIAGTSISPDQLVDPDSDAVALTPSYSDGSHSEIEVSEEDGAHVAAASITVNGQGCVYEVWSFLGAEHVAQLVEELRLVEQPAARGDAIARIER